MSRKRILKIYICDKISVQQRHQIFNKLSTGSFKVFQIHEREQFADILFQKGLYLPKFTKYTSVPWVDFWSMEITSDQLIDDHFQKSLSELLNTVIKVNNPIHYLGFNGSLAFPSSYFNLRDKAIPNTSSRKEDSELAAAKRILHDYCKPESASVFGEAAWLCSFHWRRNHRAAVMDVLNREKFDNVPQLLACLRSKFEETNTKIDLKGSLAHRIAFITSTSSLTDEEILNDELNCKFDHSVVNGLSEGIEDEISYQGTPQL